MRHAPTAASGRAGGQCRQWPAIRPHYRPQVLRQRTRRRVRYLLLRGDETGTTCTFSYADIVTEGFRTIRTSERVRFLTDPADPGHVVYVIRLDLPEAEEYYQ
jgi:hypothetical protein